MHIVEHHASKLWKRLFRFLPFLALLLFCLLFISGIGYISNGTLEREQTTLEEALRYAAIHTYARSGQYPESLDEILTNYPISYDKERFIVDYTPNGANLFPMISVLPRQKGKGGIL